MARATTTSAKSTGTRRGASKPETKDKDNGAAKSDDKPRFGTVAHLRGTLVRGLGQLTTRCSKLTSWQTDDEDFAAILTNVSEELALAKAHYSTAIDVLAELPEDFKPRTKRNSTIEVGDVVVLRESKHELYAGLFDELTVELTVASHVGTKRVLCTTEDGARAVFPITHVKSV